MTAIDFPDVEATIRTLRNSLDSCGRKSAIKPRTQKKFKDWTRDLDSVLLQINSIDKKFLDRIGSDLGSCSPDRNHLLIALIQPNMKKVFKEIRDDPRIDPECIPAGDDLDFLIGAHVITRSLAWAGDNVVNSIIFKNIWSPEKTVQKLHEDRQKLEENKNLTGLCDRWELFEHRLHLDFVDRKIAGPDKIKGTLTEAVFGIIFLEQGVVNEQKALSLIMNPGKKPAPGQHDSG
jgi:hypothetical protein